MQSEALSGALSRRGKRTKRLRRLAKSLAQVVVESSSAENRWRRRSYARRHVGSRRGRETEQDEGMGPGVE